MNTPISFQSELRRINADARASMNIVLVYETLSTALWAVESLSRLPIQELHSKKLHAASVCLSKLEDNEYRALATAATLGADLIVVSISGVRRTLPVYVESWLEDCLTSRAGSSATVATLFRCDELPEGMDSPWLHCVQRIAQEAGRGFIAMGVDEVVVCVTQSFDGRKSSAPPHYGEDRAIFYASENQGSSQR